MLGMEKSLGSVEPGYFANIVAVEGDPLTDGQVAINDVRWVMKGAWWWSTRQRRRVNRVSQALCLAKGICHGKNVTRRMLGSN
jgi:hypothetical protein